MSNLNDFNRLEENIETTIYEGLLKLGFHDNESIIIYYDLDLLNHLLSTSFTSNEDCLKYLKAFKAYVNVRLQGISILIVNDRFQITVPKEGIAFIHKQNEDNGFLEELINLVKRHSFTIEDIIAIFEHYSNDFVCEEIDNSEFQYVLYFKDSNLDKFKYCFNFDEMGGYYHRLLDFNYDKIIQE